MDKLTEAKIKMLREIKRGKGMIRYGTLDQRSARFLLFDGYIAVSDEPWTRQRVFLTTKGRAALTEHEDNAKGER